MLGEKDLNKEVKIMKVDGEVVRGVVLSVTGTDVTMHNGKTVEFSSISTVTRVGDFSS